MKYSDFLHNSMLVMVLQFGDIDAASAILNKKNSSNGSIRPKHSFSNSLIETILRRTR